MELQTIQVHLEQLNQTDENITTLILLVVNQSKTLESAHTLGHNGIKLDQYNSLNKKLLHTARMFIQ